jgi:hypothetical protein
MVDGVPAVDGAHAALTAVVITAAVHGVVTAAAVVAAAVTP